MRRHRGAQGKQSGAGRDRSLADASSFNWGHIDSPLRLSVGEPCAAAPRRETRFEGIGSRPRSLRPSRADSSGSTGLERLEVL
jgi:hypothetical protein